MRKIYMGVLLLCSLFPYAQETRWQRQIKSDTQDFMSQLAVTIDGNYLVAGSSIRQSGSNSEGSAPNQNTGYDYHILKLDPHGNTVWEKYFGGNAHDYLTTATATREGGFLLAGTSFSDIGKDKKEKNNGSSDLWLIKTDPEGNEEWQKTLGSARQEEAVSVIQSSDLGYYIAGNVQNHPKGFGAKDVWIIRLDKSGKESSEIYLGGTGNDEVRKIIPTKDGGCLVGIYSRSLKISTGEDKQSDSRKTGVTDKTMTTATKDKTSSVATSRIPKTSDYYGEGDYWIVKLDKDNKIQWQKTFGGSGEDKITQLAVTETGYLLAGESTSGISGNKTTSQKEGSDLWIISLDADGQENWQKEYSFKGTDVLMSLHMIKDYTRPAGQQDKGILLGGYTQPGAKADDKDDTFWILYLDSNGEEQWRKYVAGEQKQREERLVSAVLTSRGDYVLAGTSAPQLGQENWKIVQLGDQQVKDLTVKKEISVYPNPVKDYCYVEIGEDFTEATIQLYDMTGKLVQQTKTTTPVTKIATASLPQGIFIVNILTDKNKHYHAKIIKE